MFNKPLSNDAATNCDLSTASGLKGHIPVTANASDIDAGVALSNAC
jgi:hypothetical protein